MTTRVRTGGRKEFVYIGDENLEDTEHTAEFKEAYKEWLKKPKILGRRWGKAESKSKQEWGWGKSDAQWKNHRHPPRKRKHYKSYTDKPPYRVEETSKQKKSLHLFWKTLIFLLIIFLVLLFAAHIQVTEKVIEEKPAVKTIYHNETVSSKISFKEYLENIYEVEGTQVELKALLKTYIKGTEKAGWYVQSITDDYDNTIDLIKVSNELKNKFPNKGTTEEVYEIEGVFRRNYKTLLLEPKSITLTERNPEGYITKEKQVEYIKKTEKEIQKPKFPNIRIFVFGILGKEVKCGDGTSFDNCSKDQPYFCSYSGLIRMPEKCGCPNGERLYEKYCIKEVKCSDGTLEPECSKTKPKQCIGGKLVDKANFCGCPKDHKKIDNSCQKILRCSDGTVYGMCSKTKPLFCSKGKLIKDSTLCGCEWGYKTWKGDCIETNKAEAMAALDYINEIRKENGRSELKWSDELYELAIFRCKDMYDRKYFDHVTPDGKCVKDYKSNYNLGGYTIAENAGAVMYGYSGNEVDYASYADPKSQVDGWMSSRGHRYNLLYASHIYGVATCYKGACVFLGVHRDSYGLGAGPCTTGDQGQAFWDGAGKQPGEI